MKDIKLKFTAKPKDTIIFVIFCIFLLYLVAIGVLNLYEIAHNNMFWGLNPIRAFSSEFLVTTLVMYLFALIAVFMSTSSYFFDREKGFNFSSYATRCIDNEILMHLRSIKKLNAEVYLNEPIGKDKDDNVVTLQEVLENDERSIEDAIDLKLKEKKLYEKMASILKPREREILILRFGLNNSKPLTQNEVANIFGISRSYVSRIETKAISKLAKEIKE